MPLKKGKKNIGKNIEMMMAEGRPQDQSVAIVMREAGMPKKQMKVGAAKHTKRRG